MGLTTLSEVIPFFTKLRELCIVSNPDLRALSGLDGCTALETLWVCESSLSYISGLHHCTKLRQLNLFDNRITAITGLDSLVVGIIMLCYVLVFRVPARFSLHASSDVFF